MRSWHFSRRKKKRRIIDGLSWRNIDLHDSDIVKVFFFVELSCKLRNLIHSITCIFNENEHHSTPKSQRDSTFVARYPTRIYDPKRGRRDISRVELFSTNMQSLCDWSIKLSILQLRYRRAQPDGKRPDIPTVFPGEAC